MKHSQAFNSHKKKNNFKVVKSTPAEGIKNTYRKLNKFLKISPFKNRQFHKQTYIHTYKYHLLNFCIINTSSTARKCLQIPSL